MEDFEDLCNLANPVGGVSGPERLRLLGKTLAGDRHRCYKSIVKASRRTGQYTSDPNKVFEQVVLALYSTFHETDEARAMKAKRKYDCLEKGSESYQQFSVAWVESLAELEDAGVEKSEKDLFLDFLQKCGEQLKIAVPARQKVLARSCNQGAGFPPSQNVAGSCHDRKRERRRRRDQQDSHRQGLPVDDCCGRAPLGQRRRQEEEQGPEERRDLRC